MKKMLVSDYDDTLYINDEEIQKNLEAIENFRKKGNLFVIATGRSYYDFQVKRDKYNIKFDYLILNHGATIIKNDQIIFNQIIEKEIVTKIKNELRLLDNYSLFCCSAKESRVRIDHDNITKIRVRFNDKEIVKNVKEMLDEKYGNKVKSYYISDKIIEIISKKTNKAVAINEIVKQEKIEKNNIYVIGNGSSDIEMIKKFNGYAVENAIPEVLKISKESYQSVEQLVEEVLDETNN